MSIYDQMICICKQIRMKQKARSYKKDRVFYVLHHAT